jgi:hypothetical protein
MITARQRVYGVDNRYALVPFALSSGSRFQTMEMRSYVTARSPNPYSRFSIWFLSFDKQAWWGEEWKGKIVVQ